MSVRGQQTYIFLEVGKAGGVSGGESRFNQELIGVQKMSGKSRSPLATSICSALLRIFVLSVLCCSTLDGRSEVNWTRLFLSLIMSKSPAYFQKAPRTISSHSVPTRSWKEFKLKGALSGCEGRVKDATCEWKSISCQTRENEARTNTN